MEKGKQTLGTKLGEYRESRAGIPILIVVVAIAGTIITFFSSMSEDQAIVTTLINTSITCTIPIVIGGALVWFWVERQYPRKTLILYQGGFLFSSKNGLETYPWRSISEVNWAIEKYEENNEVINHHYTVRRKSDDKTISFLSSSYPGLANSQFNQILKQAHTKGVFNVNTKILWRSKTSNTEE